MTASPPETQEIYRYAISGSDGAQYPFQLVYCTLDEDSIHRLEEHLKETQILIDNLEKIKALIQEQFPALTLLSEDIGGRTKHINHLPPFSLGMGDFNEKHSPRLLKAALIEKRAAAENSLRRAGNEFFSNLPTFYALATRGEAGYIVATLCSVAIMGMIGYRGHSQNEDFKRVLQIWVDYEADKSAKDRHTFSKLAASMSEQALLFSGISEDADISDFNSAEYAAIAQKLGLSENAQTTQPSKTQKLVQIFHAVNNSPPLIARFVYEQAEDLCTNIFRPSTYKNIAKGLWAIPQIARHFTSSMHPLQNLKNAHYCSRTHSIHINGVQTLHDTIAPHLQRSLKVAHEDHAHMRRDGVMMGVAHSLETIFTMAHLSKMKELSQSTIERVSEYLKTPPDHISLNEDDMGMLLGAYSVGMTLGAWSYIGQEVLHIRNALLGRQARIHECYEQLEKHLNHPDSPQSHP